MVETATPPATQEIQVTPKAIQKIRQTFQKMGVEGGLRLGLFKNGHYATVCSAPTFFVCFLR